MHRDSSSPFEESEDRLADQEALPRIESEDESRPSRRGFFYRSASATVAVASGLAIVQGMNGQAFGAPKNAIHAKKKKKGPHTSTGGAPSGAANTGTGASGGGGTVAGGNTPSSATTVGNNAPTPISAEATRRAKLGKPLPDLYRNLNRRSFQEIQGDENSHVTFLVNALKTAGAPVRQRPVFQGLEQPNFQQFAKVSQALENTGTGAYLGALAYIFTPAYLTAAGTIAQIEARHSGWLNTLLDDPITQNIFGMQEDFEIPLTQQQVITSAMPFIASVPDISTLRLGYDLTRSLANDVLILNFALTLEYLEQDFYNINVPKFYP